MGTLAGMWRWMMDRLRPEAPPTHPVLLRVADALGSPVDRVQLTATWYPSGEQIQRTARTAQGLTLITWRKDAKRLSLELLAEGGSRGQLTVEHDRVNAGRVREVELA